MEGASIAAGKANLAAIELVDLQDDERLTDLYVEAVRRNWWPPGNKAVLDFWCLAEKALQDDKYGTPGRLFHSLIKSKELGRITDGQEQRAQRRMPSEAREALVQRASAAHEPTMPVPVAEKQFDREHDEELVATVWGSVAETVVYHHSVMMMCFLPQKCLPMAQREYVIRHGHAALRIEGGTLIDPAEVGRFKTLPVPFGSRARIILPYINAYALRHKTREVDLGSSLRQFISRMGLSFDGRRGQQVTEQVQALAAARILLGRWDGDRPRAQLGTIADEVSFWMEKDTRQRSLWEPELLLSQMYYDAIRERPVPMDIRHLIALARSPRRMDLYCWLTYRTAQIPKGKKVHVQLESLQAVFAPDIASLRLFKQRLKQDMKAVASVYSGFRSRVEGEVLVLESSPPPIARREIGRLLPERGAGREQ